MISKYDNGCRSQPSNGNNYKWSHDETQLLRIPVAISKQVLAAARLIDSGKKLVVAREAEPVKPTNDEIEQLKSQNAQLREQLEKLKRYYKEHTTKCREYIGSLMRERNSLKAETEKLRTEANGMKLRVAVLEAKMAAIIKQEAEIHTLREQLKTFEQRSLKKFISHSPPLTPKRKRRILNALNAREDSELYQRVLEVLNE